MESFKDLFRTIVTANKDQSREAARNVRKFLYSNRSRGKSIGARS